jgi:hypothetical protein
MLIPWEPSCSRHAPASHGSFSIRPRSGAVRPFRHAILVVVAAAYPPPAGPEAKTAKRGRSARATCAARVGTRFCAGGHGGSAARRRTRHRRRVFGCGGRGGVGGCRGAGGGFGRSDPAVQIRRRVGTSALYLRATEAARIGGRLADPVLQPAVERLRVCPRSEGFRLEWEALQYLARPCARGGRRGRRAGPAARTQLAEGKGRLPRDRAGDGPGAVLRLAVSAADAGEREGFVCGVRPAGEDAGVRLPAVGRSR